MMKFTEIVEDALKQVEELFPWDLEERLDSKDDMYLLDVREPDEFNAMHIKGSVNVPRGILETAVEWGFDETVPDLVEARDKDVIVICRSGNRSALAAVVMKLMGYKSPISLKTGLRGWADYELPLTNGEGGDVDQDDADDFFESKVTKEQLGPAA